MKKLTLYDFTIEDESGLTGHRFYRKLDDGREISLEGCLNGYDVALYDKDLNLIGEKICTNLKDLNDFGLVWGYGEFSMKALERALEIANVLLERQE